MAASPNRSPSPIASRTNPVVRTPESGNSIRKSLGGYPIAKPSITAPRGFNPVTPANSPSDFPQRNLGSKEGNRAPFSEKENERDHSSLNSSKGRSPVALKGTKNFMAPTISAASKITPSPRKKVLAERNEPARASLSSVDGKSPLPSMSLAKRSEAEEIRLKSELGNDSQVVSDAPKMFQVLAKPRTPDFDSKEELGSSYSPVAASSELSKSEKIGSKSVKGLDSQVFLVAPKILEISPKPRAAGFHSEEDPGSSSLPILDPPDFRKTGNSGSRSEMGLDPQSLSDTPKAPDSQNSSSAPVSSSPDIDPSLPPYDPKTNYLSPRPRFLRYRPNPRIEVYLNKEKREGKDLEDSFSSESCSDSEPTEETQSPDAQTDSTDSFCTKIKPENVAEPSVSETDLDNCNTHEEIVKEERTIPEEIPQRKSTCFTARPKFMSFLLLLAIVCLSMSVTDSPVIPSPSMIKDHPLTKTYAPKLRVFADQYLGNSFTEIAEFTSTKLEWVSNNLRLWCMNSLSYLDSLISAPREGELIKFHYLNLSVLDSDSSMNNLLDINSIRGDTVENEEENRIQEIEGGETQEEVESENGEEEKHYPESDIVENEEENHSQEIEAGKIQEEVESENGEVEKHYPKSEIDGSIHDEIVIEEPREEEINQELGVVGETEMAVEEHTRIESENVEELHNPDSEIHETIHEETALKEDYISHDLSTEREPVEAEKIEQNGDFNSQAAWNPESDADHDESLSASKAIDVPISTLEDDHTRRIVLGISLILLTLAATTASLYLNRRKGSVPEAEIPKQVLSPKKTLAHSVSSSSHSQSSFHQNGPAEIEMAGESGPMEISSIWDDSLSTSQQASDRVKIKSPGLEDSLSTSHRVSDRVEIKSHERKTRSSNRESMVSTSDYSAGSPSYGSFTTYEKLHKGTGEDDAMTPVRRSSRLRKQVTSP